MKNPREYPFTRGWLGELHFILNSQWSSLTARLIFSKVGLQIIVVQCLERIVLNRVTISRSDFLTAFILARVTEPSSNNDMGFAFGLSNLLYRSWVV